MGGYLLVRALRQQDPDRNRIQVVIAQQEEGDDELRPSVDAVKDRRAGDPPSLVAKADKIREVLGWVPEYDNLETIVSSSLNWEKKLVEKNR